jgi:DNA-binding MarR family transcriptional regulator/predicted GNAT family N-acyltransferase
MKVRKSGPKAAGEMGRRGAPGPSATARIAAVRTFNRFYTRRIGVLREGLLDSPFSLAEARVLYELGSAEGLTAGVIGHALDLDAGYLSRILQRFETRRLIARVRATIDRRERTIALTAAGQRAFRTIDRASRAETAALLRPLSDTQQQCLVAAMTTIETLLEPPAAPLPATLRAAGAGDWGWIVERHGVLYAREYGWGQAFEGLVAGIVAGMVARFDPAAERCWIAEQQGARVGCVCVVRHSARVAKLRLFLLEPEARGQGLGRRMVAECTTFARAAGYRSVRLWTQSNLEAARCLYTAEGYRLVERKPHSDFGVPLVGEIWELKLT